MVLAAPVVVSKLSFTAMGLVDTAMVGRLGASEQAAVGIATTYIFTCYVLGLGLIGVVNTFVAQLHGSGRPGECGVALGHGLRLATAVGVITLVALLASKPVFGRLGLSAAVAHHAYEYLFWRVMGLLPVFWYWTYNGFLEGLGETRGPMFISLAANGVNALLDYGLIFGVGPIPPLGVSGAGMATAASNTFMLLCFLWMLHRPRSPWKGYGVDRIFSAMRWPLLGQMVRLGLPMGVQFLLEIGAFLLFSIFVGQVGDAPLAAHQVALRIMSVSFMTAWGISVAATTLVGRRLGADEPEAAAAVGQRTVLLGLGFTLLCGLLFVAIPGLLAKAFSSDASVQALATPLIAIVALAQIFDGLNIISYGALKGAGDTRGPMWIVIVLNWALGVPLVYWLTQPAGLGAKGAWWGMAAVLVAQGLVLYHRFRAGRWKSLRVTEGPAF
jgi:MATE family multidrug resistance protein